MKVVVLLLIVGILLLGTFPTADAESLDEFTGLSVTELPAETIFTTDGGGQGGGGPAPG